MKLSRYQTDPLLKKLTLFKNQSLLKLFRIDFAVEFNYSDDATADDEPDFDCEFL